MPKRNAQIKIKGKLTAALNKLVASPDEAAQGAMTMPPSAKGDTAFRLAGVLTLAIVLIIVVFGGVLGLRVYGVLGMGSNKYKNVPVVYLKNGSELKFSHPFLEQPDSINGEMNLDKTVKLDDATVLSQDGRQLLYYNNISGDKGDLYLRDVWKKNKDGVDSRGILVAKSVVYGSADFIQGDEAVVYLRTDPEAPVEQNNLLCRWTVKDGENRCDISAIKILYTQQDGTVCYIGKADSGREIRIAILPRKAKENTVIQIVDTHLIDILKVENDAAVIYSKEGEGMRYDLYSSTNGEVRSLAQGFDAVTDIGTKGEVFYTQSVREEFNPLTLFEDDMRIQDVAIKEPIEEDFMVESKNLWGRVVKNLDKKAYEAAQKAYEEKLKRDELRKFIAERTKPYRSYTLYHNTGSSQTIVDSGIAMVCTTDASAATAVYYKDRTSITERFKISEVADEQDALRMIGTVLNNTTRDYYYVKLGSEPFLFQSITRGEVLLPVLDKGKGLYFVKGESSDPADTASVLGSGGGTLYYTALEADGLGLARKLDDKVQAVYPQEYKGQKLYGKIAGENAIDLYGVVDGKKTLLISGLYIDAGLGLHDDLVLGYRDYHEGRKRGELLLYSDGKTKVLTPETNDYSYRTGEYVYLLTNYDEVAGSGDLYLYSGNLNRMKLVDTNVSAVKGN